MRYIVLLLTLCIIGCADKPITDTTTVGIIPYKGISKEKIAMLKKAVENYYNVDVQLLPEQKLPKSAFVDVKSPRYRADSIINIQRRSMPKHLDYIVGLTESDISEYRLKHKNNKVHFGRFRKVVIHELGHNFGLPHCPDKKCVMTDAVDSIKTIDNANPELCMKCQNTLGM
jgi:archaemetzincin